MNVKDAVKMCIRDSLQKAAVPGQQIVKLLLRNIQPGKGSQTLIIPDPVSYTHLDVYKRQ